MTPGHALLLTGVPGSGKTTLIRGVAEALRGRSVRGFTTEEIRERGERLGFCLETLDGRRGVLAHVNIPSPHRVGRYGVDIAALDAVVAATLVLDPTVEAYLVDEIGKMECLSPRFMTAVRALLDSDRPLLATIAARGSGLIEETKRRRDVELWTVTRDSRDGLVARVLGWLRERGVGV
jgi:nucleoside-triphosphatase